MRELLIARPFGDDKSHRALLTNNLMDELSLARTQQGRVFYTYVPNTTFVTTSKDVHLALGTLSEAGLHSLANLLALDFRERGDTTLLLCLPQEGGTTSAQLVTCSRGEVGHLTLHLSPAR